MVVCFAMYSWVGGWDDIAGRVWDVGGLCQGSRGLWTLINEAGGVEGLELKSCLGILFMDCVRYKLRSPICKPAPPLGVSCCQWIRTLV